MTRRRQSPAPAPRVTAETIQAEWRQQALELPLETRQAFLDQIWAGQNLGAARDAVGITLEAAIGIMDLNIVQLHHTTLNKVAV